MIRHVKNMKSFHLANETVEEELVKISKVSLHRLTFWILSSALASVFIESII